MDDDETHVEDEDEDIELDKRPTRELITVVRGGVRIHRERSGNILIHCRGDGSAHCQAADIPDLIAAIAEILRTDLAGKTSASSTEPTEEP